MSTLAGEICPWALSKLLPIGRWVTQVLTGASSLLSRTDR